MALSTRIQALFLPFLKISPFFAVKVMLNESAVLSVELSLTSRGTDVILRFCVLSLASCFWSSRFRRLKTTDGLSIFKPFAEDRGLLPSSDSSSSAAHFDAFDLTVFLATVLFFKDGRVHMMTSSLSSAESVVSWADMLVAPSSLQMSELSSPLFLLALETAPPPFSLLKDISDIVRRYGNSWLPLSSLLLMFVLSLSYDGCRWAAYAAK